MFGTILEILDLLNLEKNIDEINRYSIMLLEVFMYKLMSFILLTCCLPQIFSEPDKAFVTNIGLSVGYNSNDNGFADQNINLGVVTLWYPQNSSAFFGTEIGYGFGYWNNNSAQPDFYRPAQYPGGVIGTYKIGGLTNWSALGGIIFNPVDKVNLSLMVGLGVSVGQGIMYEIEKDNFFPQKFARSSLVLGPTALLDPSIRIGLTLNTKTRPFGVQVGYSLTRGLLMDILFISF